MNNSKSFHVYRYQLLPIDRNSTKDLYNDRSPQEVIRRKNEFFGEVLENLSKTNHKSPKILVEIKKISDSFFSLNLAPHRPLTRETHDAKIERLDNWPHINAYIINSPDDQYLIIQEKANAFANTDSVANVLKRITRGPLDSLGLSLHIEALFNKEYFWELVEKYRNKITMLKFEFVTPNMASISKNMEVTLKSLAKETNSVKQELKLNSDVTSSLDITSDNELIKGLVDYTSAGGGDITVKVKGVRKRIHTSNKSKREIKLTELELSGSSDSVQKTIKELLR